MSASSSTPPPAPEAEAAAAGGPLGLLRVPGAPIEAWWMVAVLLALYILSILDRLVLVMLVEPIKADLGFTDFEISLLLGPAFGLFYAVFGFPLAWASDRYSRRSIVSIGVALWSMATMVCGTVASFGGLFAARMAVGIGEASLSPAAYSLIADKFPRRQLTRALAVFTLGPRLGAAAAYSVGALIIAYATSVGVIDLPFLGETKPWQLTFLMVGAPGLLMALLLFTFREPARGAQTAPVEGEETTLIAFVKANKALVGLMLIGFCAVSMASGADNWIPSFITRQYGWTPIQYGPAMSVISLVAAGSILVKGTVVDWLYAKGMKDAHIRFYTWVLAPAVLLSIGAFFLPNALAFLITFGVVQTITMGYLVYMAAVIQIITPTPLRGRMTALFLMATTLGVAAGPMAVAWFTDFVIRDPQKIGISLAIVMSAAPAIALVVFRLSLRLLKPFLAREGA